MALRGSPRLVSAPPSFTAGQPSLGGGKHVIALCCWALLRGLSVYTWEVVAFRGSHSFQSCSQWR